MATAQQVTNDVQDRVLDTVRIGQKGMVDFVRSWAQTVESTFAKLPDFTFTEPVKPTEAFESAFSFTEKLWTAQRDFAQQLFEAAIPATRAPAATASSAASSAAGATGSPKAPR
jgi:hypothetical protein